MLNASLEKFPAECPDRASAKSLVLQNYFPSIKPENVLITGFIQKAKYQKFSLADNFLAEEWVCYETHRSYAGCW
jgi:hypothetical protein